jgi:hypothetical protein
LQCRNDPEQMKENAYWEEWFQDYLPPGESANEPASEIYYPVLQDFYPLRNESDAQNVVGIIGAAFFWRDVMKHILGSDHNGIVVVFENPCSPTFTYQIK